MITCAMLVFLALGPRVSKEPPKQPDARTIIHRSVEANKADWDAFPKYSYDETDYLQGGHTRTYHVTMIFGSPYSRLVRVDGKPLSAEQDAEEKQKLRQTIQSRRNETAAERAARVARYEKERARDQLLLSQLAIAFNFKLEGEKHLGPYKVYVLKATRRRGYNPPTRDAEVLTGMEGKLWIDEETFQWVKVEAHVVHPVSIAGFLARVEPGTRFLLEKMPVGDDIWLRKHFVMRARAKILFFFNHYEQEEERYSNFRRADPSQAAPSR